MPQGGGLTIATAKADLSDPTVALKHDVEPGQYVCLSVSDNGSGMSEDVRRRAMEPFFTTKDLGKGTGLGLSMVHGVAKQSSGHLDISSELGRGTSINLFLPVANAGQDEPMRVNGSRQSDVARKKIVLVVEDDARVRKITVNRLEHLGYQAIAAENGKKALEVLATSKDIDLVFTDMVMPGGMSGAELLDRVRNNYPHIQRLLTSGYAKKTELPVDGTLWLRKPYSINEMSNIFDQLLG